MLILLLKLTQLILYFTSLYLKLYYLALHYIYYTNASNQNQSNHPLLLRPFQSQENIYHTNTTYHPQPIQYQQPDSFSSENIHLEYNCLFPPSGFDQPLVHS